MNFTNFVFEKSKSLKEKTAIFHKTDIITYSDLYSLILKIVAELEKLGLDGKKIGAKGVIYTGEGLPESQLKLIERVLGCKAICEYG